MIDYVMTEDGKIASVDGIDLCVPLVHEVPKNYKEVGSFTFQELKVALSHPWLEKNWNLRLCVSEMRPGEEPEAVVKYTLMIGPTLYEPWQNTLASSIFGFVLGWRAASNRGVLA